MWSEFHCVLIWGGTNKIQILFVVYKRICEALRMDVVYKTQVSFCVPPSARYKLLLHHASFKNIGTSGTKVGFQLKTQHLICSQRGFAVSCLCMHIWCVHSALGLDICPRFLHSWCASELNTFYHEMQVIGWLQHWADSCVFKCDLIPSQSGNLHFEYGI